MKKTIKYLFIFSLMMCLSPPITAQIDSIDLYELNLSQLSKIKITSATKVKQSIYEIPSTVVVITENEIKERGYFTFEEVLSTLSGFQFRNIQGINSYVFQRGIPNQNNLILVLIDGVQVNELNSGGFYSGGLYNLSNIERIEVIYGPASVAYGTNAISGIINIITKSAMEKQLNVKALVGTFNTSGLDFSYSYIDDKKDYGVLFSGVIKKTDKANLKGQEGDFNWTDKLDNYEKDYSFDLKFQCNEFSFGTNFMQKQSSTATLFKSYGTIYRDYGTLWNIRFINNYLKYNKKISDKFNLTSILYNRNTTVLDNTLYVITDTAQVGYYRPNNLTGFESILNFELNPTCAIISGFTFEYERLAEKFSVSYSNSPDSKPLSPVSPVMLKNNLLSFFLEPKYSPLENLFISGGIRYDNSSVYNQVITPRLGLSYIYDNYVFRISYSEAFRAPKPWDYTDGLGNSSLKPEKMKSIETSIEYSLSNDLIMNLSVYKNLLSQGIIKESNSSGYRWVNSGEVNTDGIELGFKYEGNGIKSFFNYTFTQSYDENKKFISEISKHIANVGVTYAFDRNFMINLLASYTGERENPEFIYSINSRTISPYFLLNGTISFLDFYGFNVQLIVKNILDKEYYHTSNRTPSRYRQSQRTFMFSVNYSLF